MEKKKGESMIMTTFINFSQFCQGLTLLLLGTTVEVTKTLKRNILVVEQINVLTYRKSHS